MTITAARRVGTDAPEPGARFRLHRAGILNVWQYDDQEFLLADGRMLLRGANGAGKSKTLEMLLPFAIDGDKSRITASARHHTSLLWLMTDGYDGQARVGYVWVEFLRPTDGGDEAFTCGVGIRSSASAKSATAWFFATSQRIGVDLALEDDTGPLSRPRLEERIGAAGQVFDKATDYREHVGRALFGLGIAQYDEVLRLLYWLRQPQVGEDIEPARLAGQLAQALPQLDEHAVKAAGDTFDELTAYGEQIERRAAAADSLSTLAAAYARYARGTVAQRGRAVLAAVREERRLRGAVRSMAGARDELATRLEATAAALAAARDQAADVRGRIAELEASPEAGDQRRLAELAELAQQRAELAADAEARAATQSAAHEGRAARHARATDDLTARTAGHASSLHQLGARLRTGGVDAPLPVPPALDGVDLAAPAAAADCVEALRRARDLLTDATTAVGQRQAVLVVVREALTRLDEAARRAEEAEQRADGAERRWETARDRRTESERDAERLAEDLRARLATWARDDAAAPIAVTEPLSPDALARLPHDARGAAEPDLRRWREQARQHATRATNARDRIADLERQRAEIEAEPAPAPPTPALPGTDRTEGAGLWRLVDFADHLDAGSRAGLEAALQASGLLDAWVRPDGRLLDADARDTLLAPGDPAPGPTLADLLVPDLPPDGDVTAAVVSGVLRQISVATDADRGRLPAAVGTDGSWRLAGLLGRSAKGQAQYVGATARAQERIRRLAEVDRALDAEHVTLDEAERELAGLEGAADARERWLQRIPAADELLTAWALVDERRAVEGSAETANAEAQQLAHDARSVAAARRREVHELAAGHNVPTDAAQLSALDERLRQLATDLRQAAADGEAIGRELADWAADHEDLAEESRAVAVARAEAGRLVGDSGRAASRLAELRATVGTGVAELERRLTGLREQVRAAETKAGEHDEMLRRLTGEHASAATVVAQAEGALADHQAERGAVLGSFAALAAVPGLLDSAFSGVETRAPAPDANLLHAAADVPPEAPLPPALVKAAETCASLAEPGADPEGHADGNLVWKAYTEVVSGPAGDHDPAVSEHGDLLAVMGRDDAGEATIGVLARRVAAGVAADRELLTQRERERFEQHILGELGDAIRGCRREADELVEEMNRLLAGVTTSQGIRVRLLWRLRDDVPAETREAVRLLGQPVGALVPEERATLRDALHRLIEASRAERPELSYGEHLAAALDYRSWFAFRIRYTRPEADGSWLDLHRRSPLSQGEQKVLCYLPLFAAAAAHFSSLAGAAPQAPRLVLLDDAFPKIDVRTHPLLFGLLVDLDLDFVITSERLWGDHDTVPSLAIYEALRDPAQRGIAQFEYRWDGRQLRSLG